MKDIVFVGRDKELGRVTSILSGEKAVRFLCICGPSGIGKSYFLREVARRCAGFGYVCPGIMDLSQTDYRDSSRLLTEIAVRLGVGYFEKFTTLVREYLTLQSEKRASLVQRLRESFFEEYWSLSSKRKIVLIFDTLDAVRNSETERNILPSLVEATGTHSLVIVAGREELNPTDLPILASAGACLTLPGFSLEETHMLAKTRCEQQGATVPTEESIRRIHYFANRKPLTVALALDAILQTGQEENILKVPGEEFYRKIVAWIRELPELECRAIIQASILDRRFDAKLMAYLNDVGIGSCLEALEKLRRFSFVRITDSNSNLGLHDEVRFLVRRYLDVPTQLEKRLYSGAIAYYQNELEPSMSSREAQYARLERIHYQLLLDLETGYQWWEQAFEEALRLYDIDYCRILLSEMGEHRPSLNEVEQHKVDILEGELYLAEYSPLEARPKFEYLITVLMPENEPDMVIRALRGLGQCALNSCTIDIASLSDMVEHWEKGITLSQKFEGKVSSQLVGSLLENLGFTYQLLGMHSLAEKYYLQAIELYRSNELVRECAEVLDRMGLFYREQYRSKEALDCLEQSLKIKERMIDNHGIGITCSLVALVKGDLGEVEEAEKYFYKALDLLEESMDPSALAAMYGSLGWFKFITRDRAPGNLDEAEQYARKAIAIAEDKGFGRGLSSDYHTLFHIIELKEGIEAAEPFIRKAYDCARRFSDIFFLFNSLAHIARIEYERGNYNRLLEYVAEIESYERRGARFSVFKGRILIFLGHLALRAGSLDDAVRYYAQGWRIVIERRTASTVPPLKKELEDFRDTLSQILCPKEDKTLVCEKLVSLWEAEEDKQAWSEPIKTCRLVITDLQG